MRFAQLVERTEGMPRLRLVGVKIDGDICRFEFGYVANGFGFPSVVICPPGREKPLIRVKVPQTVLGLPNGVVFQGVFSIERIDL